MHPFRTHNCNELRLDNVGEKVRVSGWVHRKRDHGNLLFIDLRDHFGLTQVVVDVDSPAFEVAEGARNESVLCITGEVVARSEDTINDDLDTGRIEVKATEIEVLSTADMLPLQVNSDRDFPEDTRLRYRYLGPAARACASQYRPALAGDFQPAPPDERAGLP